MYRITEEGALFIVLQNGAAMMSDNCTCDVVSVYVAPD